MRRREFLKVAATGGLGASLGVPVYLRQAWAQNPIKIGMPAALSGGNAQYGIQAKRAAELFAKDIKAKGILGRPVEFIYEDTAGDPATAVRKAQKLVEKDGVKFLTGVVLSSEALAVSAKYPEWKVIFMSTINGAGSLTAKSWNRYFFRVNTSGPMGARAVSLYLVESPMKRFFGLGSDYAWGRDSVGSFEKLITAAGKAMAGAIGSSRYPFTVDTPRNRDFVKRFHDMHGVYPDMFDGETYEGLEWLTQVIQKAGTDDVEKVIDAWEDSPYEGLEGPFFMRKCDHQAVQPGFGVEAAKDPTYPQHIPKILASYPAERWTPKFRTEDFA